MDDNWRMQQENEEEQQQYNQLTKESKRMEHRTEKNKSQITPIGEAKWAHIHTPKAPFKDERGGIKGEPKYQIDVVFDADDEAWKPWAFAIMAKLKSLPDQVDKRTGEVMKKQSPLKRELDEADQPTGRWYVTFKTGEKFAPGVFDKFGKTIPPDVLIGNGSKVRVSYIGNIYEAFGGGINFYLNAVQVLDLVEFGARSAEGYGFDVVAEEPQSFGDPFDSDIPF